MQKRQIIDFNNLLLWLSVVFVIYITDSMLFATSTITALNLMRRIAPLIIGGITLLFYRRIEKILFFVCCSIVISMFINSTTRTYAFYITQIGSLLFGYYYSLKYSFNEFAERYLKLIRVIAIVSLICFWLNGIVLDLPFFPVITNSSGMNFKCLFFTNVPFAGYANRRNWGPFWEPGTYQYYLNIALIFSLFTKNKHWKFDVVLFIVTLLTTLSGASIIPIPFVAFAFLIDQKQEHKGKWPYFLVAIVSLFVVLAQMSIFDEILNKIFGIGAEANSMGYRIGSLIANVKMAILHPLFGASPDMQDAVRASIIQELNGVLTVGNTNTISGYFSYFGFFVGGYFVYRIYRFTHNLTSSIIGRICLFFAVFLATSNENLMQSLLLCVIMFFSVDDAGVYYENSRD